MKQILITSIIALVVSMNSFSQPFCDQPQNEAGFLSSPACEAVVCLIDPWCCSSNWDSFCATIAATTPECENCYADDWTGWGCIAYSHWLSPTIPANGSPLNWSTCTHAGEFALVTITQTGNYLFNSNISTDFLTISDTLNNILFSGSITPLSIYLESGVYKLHVHSNAQCGMTPMLTCHALTGMRLPDDESQISGIVYVDSNCNGLYDLGEDLIPNAIIYANGVPITSTNLNGSYTVIPPANTQLSLSIGPQAGYSVDTIELNTEQPFIYTNVNFGYCPSEILHDLSIDITPFGFPPKPGFSTIYVLSIKNLGTQIANCEVYFDFSNMAGIIPSPFNMGTIIGESIIWEISGLGLLQTQVLYAILTVPSGTAVGTELNAIAGVSIIPDTLIESDYANNTTSLIQFVTSAYDPNDKTVNFPIVNHTEIPDGEGAELEYLIRFQNTGNAAATFVRVVDELPDLLDINTIHMINASHDYELLFPEPNVLEWFFDEIMLPDSTTDEPGSHGFIHFRIKTVAGVQLDDVIENNASIYFDFKEAVVTDYAVTTFMDCTEGSLEILGAESVCPGTEVVLSSNRTDFYTYTWSFGDQQQEGSSIDFMLNENTSVELFAEHPVCELSANIELEVFDVPEVEITNAGNLLTATEGAIYQWFLNNQPIAGSNTQTIIAIENGVYSVVVTFENGCEGAGELEFLSVGINEVSSDQVLLMPNPAKDFVKLQLPDGNWEITLYDITGKVYQEFNVANTNSIDISLRELSTGIYLLKAHSDGNVIVKKLVKQ